MSIDISDSLQGSILRTELELPAKSDRPKNAPFWNIWKPHPLTLPKPHSNSEQLLRLSSLDSGHLRAVQHR
jgi:hypothetical protein